MKLPIYIDEQGQIVWPDNARELLGLQAQAAGETFVLDVQAVEPASGVDAAPDADFEEALRHTAGRYGALFRRLADA